MARGEVRRAVNFEMAPHWSWAVNRKCSCDEEVVIRCAKTKRGQRAMTIARSGQHGVNRGWKGRLYACCRLFKGQWSHRHRRYYVTGGCSFHCWLSSKAGEEAELAKAVQASERCKVAEQAITSGRTLFRREQKKLGVWKKGQPGKLLTAQVTRPRVQYLFYMCEAIVNATTRKLASGTHHRFSTLLLTPVGARRSKPKNLFCFQPSRQQRKSIIEE